MTSSGRILYFTDKFRVSPGYAPAFEHMLNKAGIHRGQVITTDIYTLVDKPLHRVGNEKIWRFDPAKLPQIRAAFEQRFKAIRPRLVVVSCPAIIGVLVDGDSRLATLEKMRGGVYEWEGIPVIVTYPITAIHQRIDSRILENEDGEADIQTPYKVTDGKQILQWDWQKVGRFYAGKQRKIPDFTYSICRTLDDCYAARAYLADCRLVAPDIETGNYPPGLTCVGYCGLHSSGAVHAFVIPLYDAFAESGTFWATEEEHLIALSVIRDINDSPVPKTMQNGAYDCSYFIRDRLGTKDYILDAMLMWWSLYMELPKSLDFISSVLLDNYQYWKDDIKADKQEATDSRAASMEGYWRYNALDCYNTLFNTLYLLTLMQKNPAMQWNYRDALMRMFSGLGMSMRGLKADYRRMDYHRDNLIREMDENVEKLRYILDDQEFNINSTDQKCSLLYDVMGLRERNAKGRFVDPGKSAAAGNSRSSGKLAVKLAKSEHPFFAYILEIMEAALEPRVQMSNIFGFPDADKPFGVRGGLFMPNGRFQYALNAVGTETTRFSGKKSNFWNGGNPQNIRGKYKDWIVADDGCVFLDLDYSQSDDVFIAFESQDPDKIAVAESDQDSHAVNGELFFNIPYAKIVEGKARGEDWCVHPILGVRQNSKRLVHGGNFQMAGMTMYVTMGREAVVASAEVLGFADATSWPQEKLVALCDRLLAKYRQRYRRLNRKEWYGDIAMMLKTKGQITNAYGITRTFLGDPNDNGTQREATAFIGQSGTAGNMNRAMYEIDWGFIPERFRDGPNPHAREKPLKMNWDSHGFAFHLQVHDNFLTQLNTRHSNWKEAAANLLTVMNRPTIIKGREVRVKTEAEVGLRWGKGMSSWNGRDVHDLDRIVVSLQTQQRISA